jgi:hypothetical protein
MPLACPRRDLRVSLHASNDRPAWWELGLEASRRRIYIYEEVSLKCHYDLGEPWWGS